jgi:hypothetical protein
MCWASSSPPPSRRPAPPTLVHVLGNLLQPLGDEVGGHDQQRGLDGAGVVIIHCVLAGVGGPVCREGSGGGGVLACRGRRSSLQGGERGRGACNGPVMHSGQKAAGGGGGGRCQRTIRWDRQEWQAGGSPAGGGWESTSISVCSVLPSPCSRSSGQAGRQRRLPGRRSGQAAAGRARCQVAKWACWRSCCVWGCRRSRCCVGMQALPLCVGMRALPLCGGGMAGAAHHLIAQEAATGAPVGLAEEPGADEVRRHPAPGAGAGVGGRAGGCCLDLQG